MGVARINFDMSLEHKSIVSIAFALITAFAIKSFDYLSKQI